jgi:hypothetical protein
MPCSFYESSALPLSYSGVSNKWEANRFTGSSQGRRLDEMWEQAVWRSPTSPGLPEPDVAFAKGAVTGIAGDPCGPWRNHYRMVAPLGSAEATFADGWGGGSLASCFLAKASASSSVMIPSWFVSAAAAAWLKITLADFTVQ